MYDRFGEFINGGWTQALDGKTAPVFSPVTQQPLGQVPVAGLADTEAAIASAAAGFAAWKSKAAFDRADALHAFADEMKRRTDEAAQMISLETGKPIAQSGREWALSIDQFRWFAEEARRIYGRIIDSRVPGGRFEMHHEPVGIAAAFTAWNFPRRSDRAESGPSACGGLFGDPAPLVADAGGGDGDGRLLPSGQPACGHGEPCRRPDRGHLCADHGRQGSAQGVADRIDPRRSADDPRCRRHLEEGVDGTRRQRAGDRL